MTDTDIPPAVYGMARRAFVIEVMKQRHLANIYAPETATGQPARGQSLTAEALERVTSLAHAEADLRKLLRPDLDEADFAETLARWMLYIVGGSTDIEQVVKAMLKAAIPQIEADFAIRLGKEFERMIETGLLVDPIHSADQFPAERDKRKRMHDALWERAAEMTFSMIGSEQTAATVPAIEKAFAVRVHEELLRRRPAPAIVSTENPFDVHERRIWEAAAAVVLKAAESPGAVSVE